MKEMSPVCKYKQKVYWRFGNHCQMYHNNSIGKWRVSRDRNCAAKINNPSNISSCVDENKNSDKQIKIEHTSRNIISWAEARDWGCLCEALGHSPQRTERMQGSLAPQAVMSGEILAKSWVVLGSGKFCTPLWLTVWSLGRSSQSLEW